MHKFCRHSASKASFRALAPKNRLHDRQVMDAFIDSNRGLTLMIAESRTEEIETIVKVVVDLIN